MKLNCILTLIFVTAVTPAASARFEPVTCRNPFTPQQEIAEGNKVALEVYRQMPVLPESDPTTRYVQALGARLVQAAPLVQGVTTQWPFSFHVVASPEINAFALPGGAVFVNLGTIQAAGTEAQLAGVMAHEISHDVMRHSTCNLLKQQRKGLLYGLGAIGSALILGDSTAGSAAQMGIGSLQKVDFLHMSRDDEKQADLLGVNILAQAGYDPRGLPQFFETIQAKYGSGGAQFLSDHPNPGNRLEYVNAEIATLAPVSSPIVNSAAFRTVRTRALTQKALSSADVQRGAWRQSGSYAAGPGSNGAVVAASTSAPATAAATASPQAAMPRLSAAQLGVSARLVRYQAAHWSIFTPPSWKPAASDAAQGAAPDAVFGASSVTLAPPQGAASNGAIAYGVMIGTVQQGGSGVTDAASLATAGNTFLQRLLQQDSSLKQIGAVSPMQVSGQPAQGILLSGSSPVLRDGGTGADEERDWLVTVARPDGDLCYLIFVAPASDYATLQPLFTRMLGSFSPQ